MAMTGGTSVLLKSAIPSGFGSHKVNLYAYYKYTQSIAENKTTVYCGMYVTTDSGWGIGEWTDHDKTAPYSSYVGTTSNTFNGTMPNHDGTYWLTENQKFTVSHDNSGKGSATIYWKWNVNSSWGGYVYPSGYFNITLPTIPRQATITSAPNFSSNGNPPTVKYSNPAGNAVTALEICIADQFGSGGVVYRPLEKTGTSYTFLASDIEALKAQTQGTSLMVRYYIMTEIGGTKFWSSSDPVTFTMVEDNTTKPSVSMDVSLNNSSIPSESASKFEGMYIQGKSRLNVSLSADGKYGAKISSYSAKIDGKTYNSGSFTTDVFTSSGAVDVVGYAKDSRGFTGSASEQVNVVEYSKPLVVPVGTDNAIICYRSDGNGVRVGNSTSVWIKAMRNYYSVSGKNFCALQWRSKLITDEWNDQVHLWNDLIGRSDSSTNEYNNLLSGVVFDTRESYNIQIRAIDDIGEYDLKTFEIPTEDVALHLGKGGKNVSVGTYCDYSEEHTFYSDWKAIFDKDVIVGGNILIGENKTTLRDYILSIMNGG